MGGKLFETITISIGKKCPQSCSFCYHGASENGYLFSEEIDKLESFLSGLDVIPKRIILAGNDPLLYVATSARIISFIRKNYAQTEVEILTNLLSFDWLLNKYVEMERNGAVDSTYEIILSAGLAVTIDHRKELPCSWVPSGLVENLNVENAMFTFSSDTENTSPEFIIEWAKLLHTEVVRINLDFSSKGKTKNPYALVRKVVSMIKYGIKNGIYVLGDWDTILTSMIDNEHGHYCGGGDAYLTAAGTFACAYIKDIKHDNSPANAGQTKETYGKLREAMERLRQNVVKRRGCNTCKLEKWCSGGCLAVDTYLFCNFMRGMTDAFENDKEFRAVYLPQESKMIHDEQSQ